MAGIGHVIGFGGDLLGMGYYKLSDQIYYGSNKIDINSSSYKLLEGGYIKDDKNVFLYGSKINKADAKTFEIIKDNYNKDKSDRNIFLLPERIIESYNIDTGDILKLRFEFIWNASGEPKSQTFLMIPVFQLIPEPLLMLLLGTALLNLLGFKRKKKV